MSAIFSSKVDNITAGILKIIDTASIYGNEESKNLELYSSMMEKIAEIEITAIRAHKAIENNKNGDSIIEFKDKYDAETKGRTVRPTATNRYKDFVQNASIILNNEYNDQQQTNYDEDVVMETEISDIDPITKRQIVDPVRNKICGHHYERSSIQESLLINPRLRCPVAGCGNKQLINKSDLVDDFAFKNFLERRRN